VEFDKLTSGRTPTGVRGQKERDKDAEGRHGGTNA
jgi:hypothetical protein